MMQSEYGTTMNPTLKTALWILGVLALAWVVLMPGMWGRMGATVGSPMTGRGTMMGGTVAGGMMTGGTMGIMLLMTLTWLIMLGLVGVLIYLIVVAVRSRGTP
jgi:hypothetical protein